MNSNSPLIKVDKFYVFEEAVNALLRARGRRVLVHAYASPRSFPGAYLQVWIEGPTGVYLDTQMGSGMLENSDLPKKDFYDRLIIEKIRRYTIPKMMKAVLKYRHFGPWEFDEYLGNSRPIPKKKFNVSEATAIHEAAHVASALFYWPETVAIRWVVVSPSGEQSGLCSWNVPSEPHALASMSMAGIVAEMMFFKNNIITKSTRISCEAFISGDTSMLRSYHNLIDVKEALKALDRKGWNKNCMKERKALINDLQQVIRRVSPQIKAVATALQRTPFLTGNDVYRLCQMKWRLTLLTMKRCSSRWS